MLTKTKKKTHEKPVLFVNSFRCLELPVNSDDIVWENKIPSKYKSGNSKRNIVPISLF